MGRVVSGYKKGDTERGFTILILAKTRWKLKKAIKVLNQTFDELKLEKHPDKTFIGRVEKGFDFLGYHISPEGLSLANKTVENFIARSARLYEQEPREPNDSSRLGLYVRRWCRWVQSGLPCNERVSYRYSGHSYWLAPSGPLPPATVRRVLITNKPITANSPNTPAVIIIPYSLRVGIDAGSTWHFPSRRTTFPHSYGGPPETIMPATSLSAVVYAKSSH